MNFLFTRQIFPSCSRNPVPALVRFNSFSASKVDYYKLFPKTFPNGPPPNSEFIIDNKKLRKEYRVLQSTNHPDFNSLSLHNNTEATDFSSLLNHAYSTLNNPLTRSQYLLQQKTGIDLTTDEISKKYQFQNQDLLMEILEIHEDLENIMNEEDLGKMEKENNIRLDHSTQVLNKLYAIGDYDQIALETVKFKYWYNIKNALKEWEKGKPVTLTH